MKIFKVFLVNFKFSTLLSLSHIFAVDNWLRRQWILEKTSKFAPGFKTFISQEILGIKKGMRFGRTAPLLQSTSIIKNKIKRFKNQ